jgi:hypothetical protein
MKFKFVSENKVALNRKQKVQVSDTTTLKKEQMMAKKIDNG